MASAQMGARLSSPPPSRTSSPLPSSVAIQISTSTGDMPRLSLALPDRALAPYQARQQPTGRDGASDKTKGPSRLLQIFCGVMPQWLQFGSLLIGLLLGILGTVFSGLAVRLSVLSDRSARDSLALAKWTAKKDYREYCLENEAAAKHLPECRHELDSLLPPPPVDGPSLVKRYDLDAEHGMGLPRHYPGRTNSTRPFVAAIYILSLLVLLFRKRHEIKRLLQRRRGEDATANGRPQSTPDRKSHSHSPLQQTPPRRTRTPQASHASSSNTAAARYLGVRQRSKKETPGPPSDALVEVARYGELVSVQELLGRGVDLNELDRWGYSALHRAAIQDRDNAIKLLLDAGATVHVKSAKLETPLHCAADNGHLNAVQVLLSNGADINAAAEHGHTALHLAVARGYEHIAELLLNNGVDMEARTDTRETALHVAATIGHEGLVRLLLKHGANVEAVAQASLRPLHKAALEGHDQVALALLEHGADINAPSDNSNTPLHLAAVRGNEKVLQLLLRKGADIDAQAIRSSTALHVAAHEGQTKILQILLDIGATVDARDNHSQTPLHIAASRGSLATVKLLIDYGADLEARTHRQQTVLHKAVDWAHKDVVQLLISKHANVTAKDCTGRLAVDLARMRGFIYVVELLESSEVVSAPLFADTFETAASFHALEPNDGGRVLDHQRADSDPKDPPSLTRCLSSFGRPSISRHMSKAEPLGYEYDQLFEKHVAHDGDGTLASADPMDPVFTRFSDTEDEDEDEDDDDDDDDDLVSYKATGRTARMRNSADELLFARI